MIMRWPPDRESTLLPLGVRATAHAGVPAGSLLSWISRTLSGGAGRSAAMTRAGGCPPNSLTGSWPTACGRRPLASPRAADSWCWTPLPTWPGSATRSAHRITRRTGLPPDVDAPLLIVAHSNKDAYLDRYARPDKGFTDRSDAWWPVPYWDIDTGFASLLMLLTAVDAGLGVCFSVFRSSGSMLTGRRSACRRNSHRSVRSPSATATSRHAT